QDTDGDDSHEMRPKRVDVCDLDEERSGDETRDGTTHPHRQETDEIGEQSTTGSEDETAINRKRDPDRNGLSTKDRDDVRKPKQQARAVEAEIEHGHDPGRGVITHQLDHGRGQLRDEVSHLRLPTHGPAASVRPHVTSMDLTGPRL